MGAFNRDDLRLNVDGLELLRERVALEGPAAKVLGVAVPESGKVMSEFVRVVVVVVLLVLVARSSGGAGVVVVTGSSTRS